MTERRERRTYSEEFKEQLVELLNHGKPRREILREYDLTASSFDKWVKRINATGSSRDKDNRTPEEQEMLRLFHLFAVCIQGYGQITPCHCSPNNKIQNSHIPKVKTRE